VTGEDLAALMGRLGARVVAGDLVVFAGSLPPGAPVDTYARLMQVVQARGGATVLDTSGSALAVACAEHPEWIKPNADEAAELVRLPFARSDDLTRGVRAILALGPRRVILSLAAGAQSLRTEKGYGGRNRPALLRSAQ